MMNFDEKIELKNVFEKIFKNDEIQKINVKNFEKLFIKTFDKISEQKKHLDFY